MWDEAERLAALRRYDILDTPTAAIFDDFVQIAADICGTPVGLVSFVDETRQWFAAETGLGRRETPIELSVCAHAILQPGVLVVTDLTLDPRFAANPLVTDAPHFRFYAGAVLSTEDGLPLGTVCVLDHQPRPEGLTERQQFTLQALARQVMAQLELRRTLRLQVLAEAAKDRLLVERDAALAQKDVLMQEVHHRVKNSLSMVQSLLSLQARATTDKAAARQLKESAGRVHSFASLHEHLYRVGAAAQVDIAAYLDSLVLDQQAALASAMEGRSIVLLAEPSMWPASEAPTLGLVLVELVTNALKYGAGTVTVTLRQQDGEALLLVEDEGHGLAADFDPTRSKGLGMRIVTGLLAGKDGRLELDRSRGHTCFVARVKVPAAPV